MYRYIAVLLLAQLSVQQPTENNIYWPLQKFIDQSTNMIELLQQQKVKLEGILSSSYDDAFTIQDSVNDYVEHKQKETIDVNKNMLESGGKLKNTLLFEPDQRQMNESIKLVNPDVALTVPGIIQRNGYSCETHTVVSKGYVLNIHRIPARNASNVTPKAVLLHHGLFGSSAVWVLNGPDKALAYVLSDAGYDVWMPNIRGNKYSRQHISLKTDTEAFWNFSWQEVAAHDVPTIIDYINKVTNGAKLAYIGHSMGATILFAMLSSRPKYNHKLVGGIGLAPLAYMSDIRGPMKSLAPIASNVADIQMLFGSYEFFPKNSLIGGMTNWCREDNREGTACKNAVFSFCGYNEKQFNKTLFPVFVAHLGTGTSWKTVIHFAQEIQSGGKFQKFDHGEHHNKKIYGTKTPPEYDLSKITLPLKLFWAPKDMLSGEKDVRSLFKKLPSGSEMYMVPDPEFSHLDYLMAIDAPRLLNEEVLKSLFKAFNKKHYNKILKV